MVSIKYKLRAAETQSDQISNFSLKSCQPAIKNLDSGWEKFNFKLNAKMVF